MHDIIKIDTMVFAIVGVGVEFLLPPPRSVRGFKYPGSDGVKARFIYIQYFISTGLFNDKVRFLGNVHVFVKFNNTFFCVAK